MENLIIKPLGTDEQIPFELMLTADPSVQAIKAYIDDSIIYVAYIENRIIGEYALYPLNGDEIEIKNIAVDEAFQNRGIGKLLLTDATQKAIDGGYKKLLIGTSNASVGPLYLYQQQGFELTGIKMNFFIDNYTEPLYENGIQCKHMIMLTKVLNT